MTACMYIDVPTGGYKDGIPYTTPLILADTLATIDDKTLPILIPSNVTAETRDLVSRATMYRKVYLLEDRAAFAFSGDVPEIAECLEVASENAASWLHAEAPTFYMQNVVNQYPGKVWCVGACILPDRRAINKMIAPGLHADFPVLGSAMAIGSGARQLMEVAAQFEATLDPSQDIGGGQALLFSAFVNGVHLAMEVAGEVKDFGGYFEQLYLDHHDHKWIRGPRTAHIFFTSEIVDGVTVLRQEPRLVAYDPGDEFGRVVGVDISSNPATYFDYPLRNLLSAEPTGGGDFWAGWKPDVTTITVVVEGAPQGPGYICHMTAGMGDEEVAIELGGVVAPRAEISPGLRAHLTENVREVQALLANL